jgi:hypothetical protein
MKPYFLQPKTGFVGKCKDFTATTTTTPGGLYAVCYDKVFVQACCRLFQANIRILKAVVVFHFLMKAHEPPVITAIEFKIAETLKINILFGDSKVIILYF